MVWSPSSRDRWPLLLIASAAVIVHAVIATPISDQDKTQENIKNAKIAVAELDKLRHQKGNVVMVKNEKEVHVQNGHKMEVDQHQQQVKDGAGDKLLADIKQTKVTSQDGEKPKTTAIKTEVDVPSRHIHDSYLDKLGAPPPMVRDVNVRKKSMRNNQRVEFNPLELAKYIDETGDEEGIVLAINELIDDGLLSREEAVEYLERIKLALEMMRTSEEHHGNELNQIRQPNIDQKEDVDDEVLYGGVGGADTSVEDYAPTEEEQEVLNKLQVADYLYRQYEMQVIYQLFKDMFRNKLSHGNARDVQVTVHRFAMFLENEKQFGKISEELQSEITETMTSAMVATLAESRQNKYEQQVANQELSNDLKRSKSFTPLHQQVRNNHRENAVKGKLKPINTGNDSKVGAKELSQSKQAKGKVHAM